MTVDLSSTPLSPTSSSPPATKQHPPPPSVDDSTAPSDDLTSPTTMPTPTPTSPPPTPTSSPHPVAPASTPSPQLDPLSPSAPAPPHPPPPLPPAATPQSLAAENDDRIAKQVEWYLSRANLPVDIYLKSHMDADLWVSLELILSFPRMVYLGVATHDKTRVAALLHARSPDIEVDHVQLRIRPAWALRSNLVIRNAPSTATQAHIAALLRIPYTPPPSSSADTNAPTPPPYAQPGTHFRGLVSFMQLVGVWVAVFESPTAAAEALPHVDAQMVCGHPVSAEVYIEGLDPHHIDLNYSPHVYQAAPPLYTPPGHSLTQAGPPQEENEEHPQQQPNPSPEHNSPVTTTASTAAAADTLSPTTTPDTIHLVDASTASPASGAALEPMIQTLPPSRHTTLSPFAYSYIPNTGGDAVHQSPASISTSPSAPLATMADHDNNNHAAAPPQRPRVYNGHASTTAASADQAAANGVDQASRSTSNASHGGGGGSGGNRVNGHRRAQYGNTVSAAAVAGGGRATVSMASGVERSRSPGAMSGTANGANGSTNGMRRHRRTARRVSTRQPTPGGQYSSASGSRPSGGGSGNGAHGHGSGYANGHGNGAAVAGGSPGEPTTASNRTRTAGGAATGNGATTPASDNRHSNGSTVGAGNINGSMHSGVNGSLAGASSVTGRRLPIGADVSSMNFPPLPGAVGQVDGDARVRGGTSRGGSGVVSRATTESQIGGGVEWRGSSERRSASGGSNAVKIASLADPVDTEEKQNSTEKEVSERGKVVGEAVKVVVATGKVVTGTENTIGETEKAVEETRKEPVTDAKVSTEEAKKMTGRDGKEAENGVKSNGGGVSAKEGSTAESERSAKEVAAVKDVSETPVDRKTGATKSGGGNGGSINVEGRDTRGTSRWATVASVQKSYAAILRSAPPPPPPPPPQARRGTGASRGGGHAGKAGGRVATGDGGASGDGARVGTKGATTGAGNEAGEGNSGRGAAIAQRGGKSPSVWACKPASVVKAVGGVVGGVVSGVANGGANGSMHSGALAPSGGGRAPGRGRVMRQGGPGRSGGSGGGGGGVALRAIAG